MWTRSPGVGPFLTLCELFQMSREIKLAMISFIEYLKKKGVATYSGENVLIASEELLGVCKRLWYCQCSK